MGQKMSADLDDRSIKILQWLKKIYGRSYGETLRLMLRIFANPSPDTQERVKNLLIKELERVADEKQTADGLEKEKLEQEYREIMEMARYYNGGHHVDIREPDMSDEEQKNLRKTVMKDGVLFCPKNWIQIDKSSAEECRRAFVAEVKDPDPSKKAMHFVIFKKCGDTRDDVTSRLIDFLSDKYSELPGSKISIREIYIDGDPAFPEDYEPPYGAKIVLKEKETD